MKIYQAYVYLSSTEWGSEIMQQKALKTAQKHADKTPLIVDVLEHGGWWLLYYFESQDSAPIVVGSANDSARLRNQIWNSETEVLPDER